MWGLLCVLTLQGQSAGGWGVGQRQGSLEVWPEGVLCAGKTAQSQEGLGVGLVGGGLS